MGMRKPKRYVLGFDDGTDLPGRYTYDEARAKASALILLYPKQYMDVLVIDTMTGRACTWQFVQ